MNDEKYSSRVEIEKKEKWLDWVDEIPYLNFDPNWDVSIIPPFMYAMVRFKVKSGEGFVSVYLDCHNSLGYFDGPYWEIYPFHDDVYRVQINDTEKLMAVISESLNYQNNSKETEKTL